MKKEEKREESVTSAVNVSVPGILMCAFDEEGREREGEESGRGFCKLFEGGTIGRELDHLRQVSTHSTPKQTRSQPLSYEGYPSLSEWVASLESPKRDQLTTEMLPKMETCDAEEKSPAESFLQFISQISNFTQDLWDSVLNTTLPKPTKVTREDNNSNAKDKEQLLKQNCGLEGEELSVKEKKQREEKIERQKEKKEKEKKESEKRESERKKEKEREGGLQTSISNTETLYRFFSRQKKNQKP
eukprot:TRINITY_DN688_c0_g1_i3.p1 TRINITY_DN688_c0_g1~~TRINITY_DN688_c0_g1_i3.p1  ORF type:complete len:244 (-),score=99.04 TRINITY_DN688_c0_g1_i3:646-1377(-)